MKLEDLPDVRVDDIWEDNDKRAGGRRVRVTEVPHPEGVDAPGDLKITVQPVSLRIGARPPRKSLVKWSRFRPTSTGYTLVFRDDASVPRIGSPETKGEAIVESVAATLWWYEHQMNVGPPFPETDFSGAPEHTRAEFREQAAVYIIPAVASALGVSTPPLPVAEAPPNAIPLTVVREADLLTYRVEITTPEFGVTHMSKQRAMSNAIAKRHALAEAYKAVEDTVGVDEAARRLGVEECPDEHVIVAAFGRASEFTVTRDESS